MAHPRPNLVGESFHSWTVRSAAPDSKHRRAMWNCECHCGAVAAVSGSDLQGGKSKSCRACGRAAAAKACAKHRDIESAEYKTWSMMKDRCSNPNYHAYHRYGGRGIKVCDRWKDSYENFLADMGRRPSPEHSIDRVNNDGNYEPGNCRWATRAEQNANRAPYTTRKAA